MDFVQKSNYFYKTQKKSERHIRGHLRALLRTNGRFLRSGDGVGSDSELFSGWFIILVAMPSEKSNCELINENRNGKIKDKPQSEYLYLSGYHSN